MSNHAAGERVSRTGIYRIIHLDHRKPHEATLRKGETFPTCSVCRKSVRFEFVKPLGKKQPEHIGYDSEFMRSVMKKPKSA